MFGVVRAKEIDDAQRQLEAILASEDGTFAVLIDTTALDDFEPGSPARTARFFDTHVDRIDLIAFVTQRATWRATFAAVSALYPGREFLTFSNREAALRALRRRRGNGTRPRAPRG
jgi:hypothetical protein